MRFIPYLLLSLGQISQTSPAAQSAGEPVTKPAAPPATAPAGKAEAAPVATKAGAAVIPEKPEGESEFDKLMSAAADKIDKIEFIEAEIRQTIRVLNNSIVSHGSYKRGPNYRFRMELVVDLGDTTGKRIHSSDGRVGYKYEKVLENESLKQYDVARIVSVIDRKELPPMIRRRILYELPFVQPGDILRGLVDTMTFTGKTNEKLGGRSVHLFEGHWRQAVVNALSRNQGASRVDDLQGDVPQYARVYLDADTSWPLKVELFRRERTAEFRPVFSLEFEKVTFNRKIPDGEFAYARPAKLLADDLTQVFVNQLESLKEKSAASKPATGTSEVSGKPALEVTGKPAAPEVTGKSASP